MSEAARNGTAPDAWLAVSEIFGPTLQGEGAMVGARTHFVRLGGCDYRCSWCDSLYAVLPEHRASWTRMSIPDIVANVRTLGEPASVPWVTISGGNPALFTKCGDLVNALQVAGYAVAVETQGSVDQQWLTKCDHVCLSPKPPSSGMDVDVNVLYKCVHRARQAQSYTIKIVVFDDTDLTWALDTFDKLRIHINDDNVPLYLSAGTPQQLADEEAQRDIVERTKWLNDSLKDRALPLCDIRVLPQLHVLLWGTTRGK
jgi:7-carboxy-7-deazaguanine synthase